ncbi:MAG: epoxyqueuosine reductase QueH [Lachnospiraceae bacterium]|nr:epoxyqueuosine reductase QueH [Lachnospiraceae bacterium]
MNYQIECEKIIAALNSENNRLLLHSCCAPCSSYVLVYLRKYFRITVFYYNPNISFQEEYKRRAEEQKRFIDELNQKNEEGTYPIDYVEGDFEPDCFFEVAKGLEKEREGGERCFRCYELRLRKTAECAKMNQYDFFTTTLSISPLKAAAKLNEIGVALSEEYGVSYLLSDFKKKNGYKMSVELSKEHNLYRQDYCGCVYSREERRLAKQQMDSKNEV